MFNKMEYLLMLYKLNNLCMCGHNYNDHNALYDNSPEEKRGFLEQDTYEDPETRLVYKTNYSYSSNDDDDYCACSKKDGCYYFKPITQLKFIELLNKVKHEQEAT